MSLARSLVIKSSDTVSAASAGPGTASIADSAMATPAIIATPAVSLTLVPCRSVYKFLLTLKQL